VSPRSSSACEIGAIASSTRLDPGTVRSGVEVRQHRMTRRSEGRHRDAHPPRAAGLPAVPRPVPLVLEEAGREQREPARPRTPQLRPMRRAVRDRRPADNPGIEVVGGAPRCRTPSPRRACAPGRSTGRRARTRCQSPDVDIENAPDQWMSAYMDATKAGPHASPDLEPSLEGGDQAPRQPPSLDRTRRAREAVSVGGSRCSIPGVATVFDGSRSVKRWPSAGRAG